MNKRLLLILILIVFLLPLGANPFLGNQQEQQPEAPRGKGRTLQVLADWQVALKERMGDFFNALDGDRATLAAFSLLGISFLYGILHAAGPGHRKTIIFSLFIGRKSRWWEPFTAGFFSAGLHGMSGLVLILILHTISRRMLGSRVNTMSLYFEGITYIVLVGVALTLMILKILELTGKRHHHHGEAPSGRGLYSTLAAGSLFPCPGAVMILMFSLAVGKLAAGIWALLFLSLGMGVTVSATAYLARSGRAGLFYALKEKEELVERLGQWLETGAYLFLALYSLWAVTPFILSLINGA